MALPADAAASAVAPVESTHLFYDRVVDEAALRDALAVDGIDEEIAILRIKLRDHVKAHPEDLALMLKSVTLIVRAVTARYRMSEKRAADLAGSLVATLEALGGQFE